VKRTLLLGPLLLLPACGVAPDLAAPRCDAVERVAVVAQSVPDASYVPCLRPLPTGWRTVGVEVRRGSTHLSVLSDRSEGRPVEIALEGDCDVRGASPARPRADGVRSYLRLDSVSPAFAGTAYDVFPGGCVSSAFAFPRGPHIPLMEELDEAVQLLPRRQLELDVRTTTGVELDP
jgi:hypothetical protein